jgi:NADH-ubiquinone oxidoreductase complex I, 21 kDa subunit
MTGSTIRFRDTKYPPVKPDPTVNDCLSDMRFSDGMQWFGATVGSWGYGFVTGKPARFHLAGLCAAIGFTFGSMVVLQNVRGRLMGFRENSKEIAKYGAFLEDGQHHPPPPKQTLTPDEIRYPTAQKPVPIANLDWTKFN